MQNRPYFARKVVHRPLTAQNVAGRKLVDGLCRQRQRVFGLFVGAPGVDARLDPLFLLHRRGGKRRENHGRRARFAQRKPKLGAAVAGMGDLILRFDCNVLS